jgi:Icc-related predicted phosphoesterase
MTKFLIIGDLHGQMPEIRFRDFDAVLCVGDVFNIDFVRRLQFEQISLKKKYPQYQMKEWFDICGKAKGRKIVNDSLRDGRRILDFLDSFNVPVFLVPGNADWTPEKSQWDFLKEDHFDKLLRSMKNIRNIHLRAADFQGIGIIGYGLSYGPEYPQSKEDLEFFSKVALEKKMVNYKMRLKKMRTLFERSKKSGKLVIFLSHNVPFNTRLDKILMKSSPRYGCHYGSLVVRKIVEEYQPIACVAGHMHESSGKAKIEKTLCINAGFGSQASHLMVVESGKIRKVCW